LEDPHHTPHTTHRPSAHDPHHTRTQCPRGHTPHTTHRPSAHDPHHTQTQCPRGPTPHTDPVPTRTHTTHHTQTQCPRGPSHTHTSAAHDHTVTKNSPAHNPSQTNIYVDLHLISPSHTPPSNLSFTYTSI